MHQSAFATPNISFNSPDEIKHWRSVNDSVMGGISRSSMKIKNGFVTFYGSISLENNGGFASIRRGIDLEEMDRQALIRLIVVGDGKRYQLRFRTDGFFDGVSYASTFQTSQGEVTEHLFYLSDFVAFFRGRKVIGAPKLSWKNVKQMGVMVTDKQQGAFELQLQKIEWVKET